MTKIALLFLLTVSVSAAKAVPKTTVFEDTFALYALDAQAHQKYHRASAFFAELYSETSKKEYLYQSLRMLEEANDLKALAKETDKALKNFPDDVILKRFEIIILLKEGNYAQASQKALLLSSDSKKAPDHLLYAESRLKLSDYEGAVTALKKAYAIDFDETTAERIALIEYAHLGRKKEAVKFLQDHISTHGNSMTVGRRLATFYADGGALSDAAVLYEQLYDTYEEQTLADEAAKIYLYQQAFPKLAALLEKSRINDPMLLDLYVREKQFGKASELALEVYERENNPLYLAQSAVYKYEAASDRNDPAMIADVVEKLKKALEDIDEPLFLNYLGYLMIDHNVDVGGGMGYVRRALEKQPDSAYYIDSLAWGHYKLNECAEALRLIKQVESMIGSDEDEVRDHLKAIEACKTKENN